MGTRSERPPHTARTAKIKNRAGPISAAAVGVKVPCICDKGRIYQEAKKILEF